MLHVATDKASTPPAFTRRSFFPPFFSSNLFDSRKTICRNGSAALFKFVAISAVPGSGQDRICAYLCRSWPIDQRRRIDTRRMHGERRAAKNRRPRLSDEHFQIFCAHWRRVTSMPLCMVPVSSRLWAAPESGRRLGV